jgi:3-dehydro-L-gulonate 2-dehydrogenase
MFLALNPEAFGPSPRAAQIADEIVASLHACKPIKEGGRVRYPGEQTLRVRTENEKLGLPVEEAVWAQILAM